MIPSCDRCRILGGTCADCATVRRFPELSAEFKLMRREMPWLFVEPGREPHDEFERALRDGLRLDGAT